MPFQFLHENGFSAHHDKYLTGHVAQTADTYLTADPGVESLILDRSHNFVELDHEMISTAIPLPSADSRRVVVGYNHPDMTIAVDWDVKNRPKQKMIST